MKFRLSRSSHSITENDIVVKLLNVKKIDHFLYYYYEIELNSFEELTEFQKYVGYELVINFGEVNSIEIYDDYRE
ncbi:MAG: hypothetical protein RR255_00460 [Bacilli bacterium]